jgi:hypothetical protein
MNCEVKIKDDFSANYVFIEDNFGNLGMTCSLTTNLFIGWVFLVATRVTTNNIDNSLELRVGRVKTPETATG